MAAGLIVASAGIAIRNSARTRFSAFTVTEQVNAAPEQSPLQPPKVDPRRGAAARVTMVDVAKGSSQSAPQAMPGPPTVPDPSPVSITLRSGHRLRSRL